MVSYMLWNSTDLSVVNLHETKFKCLINWLLERKKER